MFELKCKNCVCMFDMYATNDNGFTSSAFTLEF